MSLPAVHSIRLAFPKAKIWLLIQQGLEPLLGSHPDVDAILTWRPQGGGGWISALRWGQRIRKLGFDAAVILNPTRLFHVACFLAGIRVRIGYQRKWGFLLTASCPDTKSSRHRHEAQYNLELIQLLGIEETQAKLSLPVDAQADREIQRLLQSHGISSGPLVGLHPWTSLPTKSWALESFQKVAESLVQRGLAVVVLGETDLPCHFPGTLDLVNRLPLRLLPALLKQCAVLVSNDSGPVHVAAAVGTPAVVIAPTEHALHLKRWSPLGERHQLLLDPTIEEVVTAVRRASTHTLTAD